MDWEEFRDGLFAMHTRRFGTVVEMLVQRLGSYGPGRAVFHDLYDDLEGRRVEVKGSRVLRSHEATLNPENVLAAIGAARATRRLVPYDERTTASFDCNIQQVKRAEFDVLYYVLFFEDRVLFFSIEPSDIGASIGYSDHQHKGNEGEGQFHITNENVQRHIDDYLYKDLGYPELLDLLQSAVPK